MMKILSHLLFLPCLLVVLVTSEVSASAKPGAQVRLTQLGLDYVGDQAIAELTSKIKTTKVPDVTGKTGNVEYGLTKIKVNEFKVQESTLAVENGLTWEIRNAGAALSGDFWYKYKKWFVKISGKGSIDVKLSGVTIKVWVTIDVSSDGKVSLVIKSCTDSIRSVSVKFRGGKAWIYNIFKGYVGRKLQTALQGKLCNEAKKAIDKVMLSSLMGFGNVDLKKDLVLDYNLVASPTYGSNYMDVPIRGDVLFRGDPTRSSLQPDRLLLGPESSRMVYVQMGDYVINTLAEAMFRHNKLNFTVEAKNFRIPDTALKVDLVASYGALIPPTLHTNANNMVVSISGLLSAKGWLITGQTFLPNVGEGGALSLQLVVNVTVVLKPSLSGGKLTSKVLFSSAKSEAVGGNLDILSDAVLDDLGSKFNDHYMLPKLQDFGTKGVQIPMLKNFELLNPTLQLQENAITVATNLRAMPKTAN